MTKKLWDKGEPTSEAMQKLTVGSDPDKDRFIVEWDCVASGAHAQMLKSVGILNEQDLRNLLAALSKIHQRARKGEFTIEPGIEDCHSAIEMVLTEECGDSGKRIHTGRSRNDQVNVAMRLFLRAGVLGVAQNLVKVARAIGKRFNQFADVPLPGYTHMQRAMPTSVGMWLHSFLEGVNDLINESFRCYDRLNRSPLGAAAGFGSGLPLDKELTAKLMGFEAPIRSPIYAQNSRGSAEVRVAFQLQEVGALFEKFAWDIVLFCSEDYGFFKLPVELTTGSSIMPQKRNPDLAELLRARSARLRARLVEIDWVRGKLPSNYHRDLQLTKEPVIRAFHEVDEVLASVELLVDGLNVNRAAIDSAMTPEIFATYEAYRLVQEGTPFRDAYRQVGESIKQGSFKVSNVDSFYQQVLAESKRDFATTMAETEQLDARLKTLQSAQEGYVQQCLSCYP